MKHRAPETLSVDDLRRGHEAYVKHEPRDAMYKVATLLVKQSWGNPSDMADGIGVLLLTWNAGFYRYGSPDFDSLHKCIEKNLGTIEGFKNRNITTLVETDEERVKQLFNDLLSALRRPKHKKSPEAFSPVSVAKTLHILAPNFFPLWDDEIAKKGYGCYWYSPDRGALKYWQFMLKMKKIVESLHGQHDEVKALSGRPVLKLIDEYNYSRFSKDWLR
jgi:hypothetical protein